MVELHTKRKIINFKWILKKKQNAKGQVEKYEACRIANGYLHVVRIDYGEIFSLIIKLTSIRCLLFMVVVFDLEIE